jgi:hypothetical protein
MTTASQKQWMTDIAEWYQEVGFRCVFLGNLGHDDIQGYNFQLHHVGGRKLKQNKIPIGDWFILPLPVRLHDVGSNHPYNVTHHKHAFTDHFGLQSELFKEMIDSMVDHGAELPFGQDVINAIMDTRK